MGGVCFSFAARSLISLATLAFRASLPDPSMIGRGGIQDARNVQVSTAVELLIQFSICSIHPVQRRWRANRLVMRWALIEIMTRRRRSLYIGSLMHHRFFNQIYRSMVCKTCEDHIRSFSGLEVSMRVISYIDGG
jgi:hypothetical protein